MKTIKQSIIGLALSVFSISVNAQCPSITGLSVTNDSNGTATVVPIMTNSVLIGPASGIYWSTYPNASQTTGGGTFQFPANGTYSVCATYIDSTNFSCGSSMCTSVVISNMSSSSCNAGFTTYTDNNCVTHFTNTSTGSNLTYQWYDINNGFTLLSTNTNPSLSLSNGTHLISLYSYSNGNYCDSLTQVVTVGCAGTGTTSTCQASFYTFTDSLCITHFINTSVAFGGNNVSQWNINGTSYSTPDVTLSLPNGYYNAYLFNYSNGVFCDSAYQYVNVACGSSTTTPTGCQVNSTFYIFADSTNTGNYFAYNLSSGNGNLSYLWNFGDGTTSTQQYPFHQYAVPGQYVVCLTTTNTYSTMLGVQTCSDTYCDSSSVQRMAAGFLMSQINVIPQSATGIKQAEILIGLNAYPNPIADELTIEATTKDNSKLNYMLIDALGRVVLTGNIENSKATINTSALEKGFYSLSITDEKGSSLKAIKLVK